MYHKKKLTNEKRGGPWAYLALGALLTGAIFALGACQGQPATNDAKPIASAPTASPAQQRPKPVVSTPKLTPKAVTASNSQSGLDPNRVIDGNLTTNWAAGGPMPQWVQFDLGEPMAISKVLLLVVQLPAGSTTHKVYGGPSPDQLKLLGTLEGYTQEGEWLEVPVTASDVRYLKVLTTNSPSWIAWGEIEIYK